MDLAYLLRHDVSDHIIKYMAISCVINITYVKKNMPDLLDHNCAKELFSKEMLMSETTRIGLPPELSNMLRNNKKIISFIYNHKLVRHFYAIINGEIFNFIDCWSKDDTNLIQKIISNVNDKNNSYLYYFIFINKIGQVAIDDNLIELFKKHNIYDLFCNFFCKNYNNSDNIRSDNIKLYRLMYPWITIPLIINDKDTIGTILHFYDTSPYPFLFDPFESIMIADTYYRNKFPKISDYIVAQYPEFLTIIHSITAREKKYEYERDMVVQYWDPNSLV